MQCCRCWFLRSYCGLKALAERVAVEDVKSQFPTVFDTLTSFRAKSCLANPGPVDD